MVNSGEFFAKPESYGQIVLPDRSLTYKRMKIDENAKLNTFNIRHFG